MLINGVGLLVNGVLDCLWIFGYGGFPEMGMLGAGWATVAGMWAGAITAFALLMRRKYRRDFATATGWRFDRELFGRLCRYGLPSGFQWFLEGFAFTVFLLLVGRMGKVELAATNIAITLNIIVFLPALGLGQAVTTLVGQRLGENRPELAERSSWSGFQMATLYMSCVAAAYVLWPDLFVTVFRNEDDAATWSAVAAFVPVLLRFVAVYSLVDSMNLIFTFALKGAGDTRFATLVPLVLSWPIMVVPTYLAVSQQWGLEPAWGFASAYIITQALVFWWRFRGGKWKSMRVIETAPSDVSVPSDVSAPPDVSAAPDASPPIEPSLAPQLALANGDATADVAVAAPRGE